MTEVEPLPEHGPGLGGPPRIRRRSCHRRQPRDGSGIGRDSRHRPSRV